MPRTTHNPNGLQTTYDASGTAITQGGVVPPDVDAIQTADFDVRVIVQKAQAEAADYAVVLGWRPSMVLTMANNTKGMLINADDLNTAVPSTGVGIEAAAAVAANAITIKDWGYILGQNDAIKSDNARIVCLAFKGTGEAVTDDLGSAGLEELSQEDIDSSQYAASASRTPDGRGATLSGDAFKMMTTGVFKWTG